MSRVKTAADDDNLIAAYQRSSSIRKLAVQFGIPRPIISNRLKTLGLKVRTMNRPLLYTAEEIIVAWNRGETLTILARRYQSSLYTLSSVLKANGIDPSKRKAKSILRRTVDVDYVIRRYGEGFSIQAIANELSVDFTVIQQRLRTASIPLRTQREANLLLLQSRGAEW